jgi:esterase/lipase
LQQQLFDAVKMAYQHVKTLYPENQIVILGYSIGTGPAAWLASQNHPQKLILLAPYYSLADEAKTLYPFLPSSILKYPLQTYEYIQHTSAPIVIFHGDEDELINRSWSHRLQKYFKPGDKLIILKGQHHNGIDDNKIQGFIEKSPVNKIDVRYTSIQFLFCRQFAHLKSAYPHIYHLTLFFCTIKYPAINTTMATAILTKTSFVNTSI